MKLLIKPESGDFFFYIPAVDEFNVDEFFITRYIEYIKPNLGHLIEVFKKFYTEPPEKNSDVNTNERLFRPIFCSMRFSGIPRWRILFSNPDYDKSDSGYESISFAFGSSIWVGRETKDIAIEKQSDIEPSICWRMDHFKYKTN